MKKYGKYVLILVLFLVCPSVSAKEVDHFTTKADNDVVIEDTYNASVAVAGDSVSFDGIIKGIALGAGNKVTLNGETDYAILLGNSVTTNSKVNNDIFVGSNLVTTKDKSEFKRDAVIMGADVELNGNFDRNVSIYAQKVILKNVSIKGNIKLYTTNVVIEKSAKVDGTLSYPEDSKYSAEKGAIIGKVVKTDAIQNHDDENYFATVSAKMWSFLCYALVFAAISLLFPRVLNKINEKYEKVEFGEVIEVFTKGLVVMILVPVIAILLCCTMIGIPLGIILVLLYGIGIYLATVFTAYLIGYKIWQKVFNKDINILFLGLIGLFILFLLSLIPGVRTLVSIITMLIGLGLIFEIIRGKTK